MDDKKDKKKNFNYFYKTYKKNRYEFCGKKWKKNLFD